jgi:diguanylate cyclase (GGDEF)-like protein/PAS domain S-box-containing protein
MNAEHPRPPSAPLFDLLHAVAQANGMPIAYLRWPSGQCLWATAAYARLLDMPTQELVGKAPQHYLPPCDSNNWQSALGRVATARTQGAHMQAALAFAQGQHLPCQLVAHMDGERVSAIVVAPLQDLSFIDAMQMVQDSDTRMRRYAAATNESIIFFRHGRIFDANPAAVALTGYPLLQLIGRPATHLLPHALRESGADWFQHGTHSARETRLLHHAGQELDVEITISRMPEDGDNFGLIVLRDITERKRAEADMHFLAYHDPLTRLPNRQGLMLRLRQALQNAAQCQRPAAVMSVDLDRFKDANDLLGHTGGDKLLVETARRLRSKVHPDDIVARLAGDEFVVVLCSPLTACQPECILRELRFSLNKGYALPNGEIHLPASIGVSLYPEDGCSAEALMLNASAAMQTAKRLGQGCMQYYRDIMDIRPSHLLAQDRLLREAIASNQGLVVHYQPQWDLAANRLEGFEALVRWQHPERGLLPPGEFISFAESRGLISMVDRWVMRAVCKQISTWCQAGLPPVVVSVNMSAIEFNQINLAQEVQQILTDTGVDPQWLEIELTETTLMKQSAHVLGTLEALQKLGVRLSIDDFGTGYSSLAYLKRYPLDKIKIDRSFVKDTPEDADDVSIIAAIIQMAHSLNLRTVAEGVETQAQWDLLKNMGCDLIQGYYLARPMPAADALRWQQQRCATTAPQ